MSTFQQKIDAYALPVSMLIGVVFWPLFMPVQFLLGPLLFLMLFFTFCKINPLDLRLRAWHWVVLAVQLALTFLTWVGLNALSELPVPTNAEGVPTVDMQALAQGLMLCFLMPTATAAPIIAGKLGGSIQNLTTFTLLSNFITSLIVPLFFPYVNPQADMSFLEAGWLILQKVGPVLLGPFIAAWLLRIGYNAVQKRRHGLKESVFRLSEDYEFQLTPFWASMPFYLWACSLIVLMAGVTHTLWYARYSMWTIVLLCVGAMISCVVQYKLGHLIGYRFPASSHGKDYKDIVINPAAVPTDKAGISRITAGQAFGQKNTSLAVWMAQMYLTPMSVIAPAAYIIWQNLFNSYELALAARGKRT